MNVNDNDYLLLRPIAAKLIIRKRGGHTIVIIKRTCNSLAIDLNDLIAESESRFSGDAA